MHTPIIPWKSASAILCVGQDTPGWTLVDVPPGAPDVPRTFTFDVKFAESFNSVPLVHAAVSGFDIDHRDTARLSVSVANVTTDGFTLAVVTWRETRVYSVEVSWLVIGN